MAWLDQQACENNRQPYHDVKNETKGKQLWLHLAIRPNPGSNWRISRSIEGVHGSKPKHSHQNNR